MTGKRALTVLVATCAIAGTVVAIAQGSSTKSTASKADTTQSAGTASGQHPPGGMMGGRPGDGPGGAVHSLSVVPDKAGTSFITVTSDRGTVQSVDSGAGTITLVEGTESTTYKTLTLTIPSGATITRDGKKAALGEVVAKDRVSVSSSSEGTTVFAADSSFKPQDGKGGPPGMRGPGGPPPAAQEATGAETKSATGTKSGTGTTTTE
ncbi:MAG TPA: hypothetical protein VHW67_03500 [Solirubrobacteraceae bacterium]|nr:hypothetical protein [Solirubrobacteraceae bacterium]